MQVADTTLDQMKVEAESIIGGSPDQHDYPTSRLASYLAERFDRNERAKEDSGVKFKLLEDLRQYEGVYDEETRQRLERQGGTKIFDKITMMKCDTLEAWVNYVLEGLSENKVWDIEPTPKPELPPSVVQQIKNEGMQMIQQQIQQMHGPGQPPPDPAHLQWMAYEFAVKRAGEEQQQMRNKATDAIENMKRCMLDQQVEGGYRLALKNFIRHFCIFKNAFMKGPFFKYERKLTWGPNFQPEVKRVPAMKWETVSPFDMYPDPSAKTINDGDLFERTRYSRQDLEDCIGIEGFNDEAIKYVLSSKAGPPSTSIVTSATASVDDERGWLEERSWYGYRNNQQGNIYEGVIFWGSIAGHLLQDWDLKDKKINDYETYEINAIMIGNTVIKADLNPHPLGHRPYTTASFKNIPSAIWGISLPEVLRDVQKSANSVQRALINNVSISSGPQVLVDLAQLPTGGKVTNIQPWKIWQVDSRGNPQARMPGVSFVHVPSNAAELSAVLERLEQQADQVSQIPKFAHGATQDMGPAGSTATGMSIVQGNATKGMRNVIREITMRAIQPQIQMQYDWNMIHNPDLSIKGDAQIKVGGPIAILEKEATQAKRMEFLQFTMNDLDHSLIGKSRRANLLRTMTGGLDMADDQLVKPQEVIEQEEANEMQQSQAFAKSQEDAQKSQDQSQHTQDMVKIEGVHGEQTKAKMQHEIELMKIKSANPEFNLGQEALNIHSIHEQFVPGQEQKEAEHFQIYHPELWAQRQDLATEQMKASGALELEENARQEGSNENLQR